MNLDHSPAVVAPGGPAEDDPEVPLRTQVVLDTSALVADSEGVFHSYPGADLIVPLTVVEELDGLKKRLDSVGGAARDVLRRIEKIRIEAGGDLETPRPLPGGATLRVALNGVQTSLLREHGLDPDKPDNRIIGTALGQRFDGGPHVRLVSNDTGMRVKAATFGLDAIEHDPLDGAGRDDAELGWREFDVERAWSTPSSTVRRPRLPRPRSAPPLRVNEFGVLHAGSQSALVRRHHWGLGLLAQRPARLGPAAAQQGAALRPRPAARRRRQGGRPRRSGRHRQDPDRGGGGAAAGGGGAPLLPHLRVPAGRARRQGRDRVPARHARREARPVDGRHHRRGLRPDQLRQPQPGGARPRCSTRSGRGASSPWSRSPTCGVARCTRAS